jgi:hypothetical protein
MSGRQKRKAGAAPGLPPETFVRWFAARGWRPHAHQLALLAAGAVRHDALLIAPTGGGKTLAGFLPSLVDLAGRKTKAGRAGTFTRFMSRRSRRLPSISPAILPHRSPRWTCPSGSRPVPGTPRPRAARASACCPLTTRASHSSGSRSSSRTAPPAGSWPSATASTVPSLPHVLALPIARYSATCSGDGVVLGPG